MSLRGRIPDAEATYQDPIFGVNLHAAEEDLGAGESPLMQNMVRFGRLGNREGSNWITTSQVAASYGVRGGYKFYYGGTTPSKVRLIAYDTNLSSISDAGSEAVLWSTQTSDLNTFFNTWSITDQVYISNGTDPFLRYDGTFVGPVGSTNLVSATYRWIASGSGTDEYYCELIAGGDPSIADPTATGGVWINGAEATNGTVGSLSAGEWDYGDNDTLGFTTVYVRLSDGTDPDTKTAGYVQSLISTTVPGILTNPAPGQVIGISDRLFAITSNGIERCDARDPTVWSVDSSWATFRPSQAGIFKAHIPHMVSSTDGSPINGALAMTENAYYFYTGNSFGVDVTSATGTDPGGDFDDDSRITHIAPVGAFGPKSVASVPDIGTFWLTTSKNIYYVPIGHTAGRLIGTRIINTGGSATTGLESMDVTQGDDAWMIYDEPYLMIGFTLAGGSFPTYQYWLDLDKFRLNNSVPIWYGPMTGQSISSVWKEDSQGDDVIAAGEADPTVGVFVYTLRASNVYKDKVGTDNNDMDCQVSTYLKSGGAPSREKLVQGIEVEMNTISGTATADIADLSGTILADIPLEKTFV